MEEPRLVGTVVEREGSVGLDLRTDDGGLIGLIPDHMGTSVGHNALHAQGRVSFEPFLGQKVHASGYQDGDLLWSAVVKPLAAAFETKALPDAPDAVAPDGSDVRVLLRLEGGSMAHFELGPGLVSRAVTHRTVSEIWYTLEGRGEMWRKFGRDEAVVDLRAGVCLTIPQGTHFQFRAFGYEPLSAVGVTMPPWPLDEEKAKDEAIPVHGKWSATVGQ